MKPQDGCPRFDLYGGFACINCKTECDVKITRCNAIIPARIGSKRIPRKNIRLFRGVPVIEHTIKVALEFDLFDHVYVSTDSDEIAAISENAGASILIRDSALCADDVPLIDVMSDAVSKLDNDGDITAMLYPVSPYMRRVDLNIALSTLVSSPSLEYVFSAHEIDNRCLRAFTANPDPMLIASWDTSAMRSQDLPKVYCDSGMFVFGRNEAWISKSIIFPNTKSRVIIVDNNRAIDVDTEDDWILMERCFIETR